MQREASAAWTHVSKICSLARSNYLASHCCHEDKIYHIRIVEKAQMAAQPDVKPKGKRSKGGKLIKKRRAREDLEDSLIDISSEGMTCISIMSLMKQPSCSVQISLQMLSIMSLDCRVDHCNRVHRKNDVRLPRIVSHTGSWLDGTETKLKHQKTAVETLQSETSAKGPYFRHQHPA